MDTTVPIANLEFHVSWIEGTVRLPGPDFNVTQTRQNLPDNHGYFKTLESFIIHAKKIYRRFSQGLILYLFAVGIYLSYTKFQSNAHVGCNEFCDTTRPQ
jgi:hypothetical protein